MSVLTVIRGMLKATTQNPKHRSTFDEKSEGAYWCHDCDERIRDVTVDGEGAPSCPSCGDEMAFVRSIGSAACAC